MGKYLSDSQKRKIMSHVVNGGYNITTLAKAMSKFIEECLVKTETIKTPLTLIRKWYYDWCKDNGIVPYQLRRFQKEFLESCYFDISYGQRKVYVKACRKAADEIIKIESKE